MAYLSLAEHGALAKASPDAPLENPRMARSKLENLEYLIMDMGTEVFQLKAEIAYLKDKQKSYEQSMGDLYHILLAKNILADKEWHLPFPVVEYEEYQERAAEAREVPSEKKNYH